MKVTIKIRPADYQNAYGTGSWFFQTEDITNISTANIKILSMFDKALMEASTAEEAYVKAKSAKGYTRLESVWKAKLFVDGKLVVDNEAQLITPYTTTFRNALLANMNISYIMRHVTCGPAGSPNPDNATVTTNVDGVTTARNSSDATTASSSNGAATSSSSDIKMKNDSKITVKINDNTTTDSADAVNKSINYKPSDFDSFLKFLNDDKLLGLWLTALWSLQR